MLGALIIMASGGFGERVHVFKDISSFWMNDNETMKISNDLMLSDFKETCNIGMFLLFVSYSLFYRL